MGHAGAAQSLHQGLFNNAVFDVERQLARALLGGAPAHTVGQTGDILDLLGLDPLALLGDGSRTVVRALGNGAHVLHFGRINHVRASFPDMFFRNLRSRQRLQGDFRLYYIGKRLPCQGRSVDSLRGSPVQIWYDFL